MLLAMTARAGTGEALTSIEKPATPRHRGDA
jgi:hypothetical protein